MSSEVRPQRKSFTAGDWIIEPELNAILKDGHEWHVEPKVMQVLLVLASQPDHVFSKEEIISAVWPDTFVSEDVLTRCISILRRITGDKPQTPRFIQTVPKVGYRLVAPLAEAPAPTQPSHPQSTPSAPSSADAPAPAEAPKLVSPTSSHPVPSPVAHRHGRLAWMLSALLVLLAVGGVWFAVQKHHHTAAAESSASFRTRTFTSYPGEQIEPAFSPDGRTIAFVRIAEDGVSERIYLKTLANESLRELTHDSDFQFSPTWSPDGSQIAYFARSGSNIGLYIASATSGGQVRRVYVPHQVTNWEQGALSWSPDGKSLIFPDHAGEAPSSSIFRLDLASLRAQPITAPPAGWEGDLNPAWSPDGKRIAFTRASESAVRDVYFLAVADGSVHQVTHDRKNIDSLTWNRDGATILYSSNREGKYALWQAALDGSAPVRLAVGTEDAYQPSVGPRPGQIAYTQGSAIWSTDRIQNAANPSDRMVAILSSTQQDSAPSLSPDQRFFAFQTRRSGDQELWIASIDGSSLRQLTFFGGPLTGSPSWSHSGSQVAFDSRPGEHSHIFAIPAAGGHAAQLTFGDANDIIPRWSMDDQTVFFRSNRGGRWQIWKVSVHGGEPKPITSDDGIVQQQSTDGKWLYYTRAGEPGLWRVATGGGPEVRVLPQPAAGYWGYFQVTPKGIYFLDHDTHHDALRLYLPESGETKTVVDLPHAPPAYQGLTVSRDGKVILMTDERDAERHITLVESYQPHP
jgi:Tol biopolymer transport system component/DNA-binding winged helix-turn-helix (wHTH) protein